MKYKLKMYNAKKYRKQRKVESGKNGTKILYRITIKIFFQ